MTAITKAEQNPDSRRQSQNLDRRYGKIGISAVAAALCSQGERPAETETRYAATDYERD